jgi:hypothetical protein
MVREVSIPGLNNSLSVLARFICGTQDIHKELEDKISR